MGKKISRRDALALGAVSAAGAAAVAALGSKKGRGNMRMPVVFLPHGGGPWPFVDLGMDDKPGFAALADYLRSVAKLPKEKPKALLVVSAHWEEEAPTVMTAERPPMF